VRRCGEARDDDTPRCGETREEHHRRGEANDESGSDEHAEHEVCREKVAVRPLGELEAEGADKSEHERKADDVRQKGADDRVEGVDVQLNRLEGTRESRCASALW
jgi:hypothetical protein